MAMAALVLSGWLYYQWSGTLDDLAKAESKSVQLIAQVATMTVAMEVLNDSLDTALAERDRITLAYKMADEAIKQLEVRSEELEQIKEDVRDGNFEALGIDPAIVLVIERLRNHRNTAARESGSP